MQRRSQGILSLKYRIELAEEGLHERTHAVLPLHKARQALNLLL